MARKGSGSLYRALCVNDCFGDSTYFYKAHYYNIDPGKIHAVHFKFEEDPEIVHIGHWFDKKSMCYVKNGDIAPPEEPEVENSELSTFVDLEAQARLDLLKAESQSPGEAQEDNDGEFVLGLKEKENEDEEDEYVPVKSERKKKK